MTDHRGRLLVAALGFAGCSMPSYDPVLHALRSWLDSWSGIGHVAVAWRAKAMTFNSRGTTRRDGGRPSTRLAWKHSPTSATGTGWERTPWRATQRAAWEALRKVSI
jgi:hypothetical protein